MKLANKFNKVRVDVDDRGHTLGKKIRAAGREWIPATIVMGENENKTGKYDLKIRTKDGETTHKEMSTEGIQNYLSEKQGTNPFRDSYLPKQVSKQIRFGSSY